MGVDHGTQLVHHRAAARHHEDADQGAHRLLQGRLLRVGAAGGLDGDLDALIGERIGEELRDVDEIRGDRAAGMGLLLERAVGTLPIGQPGPLGITAARDGNHGEAVVLELDVELALAPVGAAERVAVGDPLGLTHVPPPV
jgi:hypothetical protein